MPIATFFCVPYQTSGVKILLNRTQIDIFVRTGETGFRLYITSADCPKCVTLSVRRKPSRNRSLQKRYFPNIYFRTVFPFLSNFGFATRRNAETKDCFVKMFFRFALMAVCFPIFAQKKRGFLSARKSFCVILYMLPVLARTRLLECGIFRQSPIRSR